MHLILAELCGRWGCTWQEGIITIIFVAILKSGLAGIALIILIGLAGIALIILIPLWLLTVVLKFLVNTINWIIGKPKTENQGGVEQVKTRSWLKQAAVIGVDLNIQQWRKNSAEEKKDDSHANSSKSENRQFIHSTVKNLVSVAIAEQHQNIEEKKSNKTEENLEVAKIRLINRTAKFINNKYFR